MIVSMVTKVAQMKYTEVKVMIISILMVMTALMVALGQIVFIHMAKKMYPSTWGMRT